MGSNEFFYEGPDGRKQDADLHEARTGASSTPQYQEMALQLKTATLAGKVPAGTVLYRGIKDFHNMGFKNEAALIETAQKGLYVIDDGFMPVASQRRFAHRWGGSGPNAVLLELRITKATPAVHMDGASCDSEYEAMLTNGVPFKAVGYRKEYYRGTMKHILVLETK